MSAGWRGGERLIVMRNKLTANMFKSLVPEVLSMCGTLTRLQPGAVPRQTAGLSEAYRQKHAQTQR